ncbi:SNF2 domain-containing protein CLASSY 1-like [Lotus japonicus]|uniref:SNF2 domain-containing protein CLASSY 1-like n=1 Tax=Lotus japonicus TaxID=34305 RepID=UPI002584D122|nr:SNF2 domain-containing protein CLASSY 1-like [Lotus japonicus]
MKIKAIHFHVGCQINIIQDRMDTCYLLESNSRAPRKRYFHQGNHPLNVYPFEAFAFGSWKPVELIKIESGRVILHFMDKQEIALDKCFSDMRPKSKITTFADMRIRSRKATLSDCASFLRCGIDVCALSNFQSSDDSNQSNSNPVWADVKINSIERKPHNPECSCVYHVRFYTNQGSLGSYKNTLSKDVQEVGLNQIFILQKLGRKSLEDQPFRWDSSEDYISRQQTRLSSGKFVGDISCLAYISLMKNMCFCVRSLQNKILYQIMGIDTRYSDSHIRAMNFKIKGHMSKSSIFELDTMSIVPVVQNNEAEVLPPLRRSTRRIREPERYLGYCDDGSGFVYQTRKSKMSTRENDEKLALVNYTFKGDVETSVQKVDTKVSYDVDVIEKEHLKPISVVLAHEKIGLDALEPRILQESGECSSRFDDIWGSKNNDDGGMCNIQLSGNAQVIGETSSCRYYNLRSGKKYHRKDLLDSDDMMMDLEPKWEGLNSKRGEELKRRRRSDFSRNRNNEEDSDEEQARRRRALDVNASKEMIDSYLKDMDKLPAIEEAPVPEKWKEAVNFGKGKETEKTQRKEQVEEEVSEIEMLWREMDDAMIEGFLQEQTEDLSAPTKEETTRTCEHDYRLDEQLGIYCHRCGFVKEEIRYIMPSFAERRSRRHKDRRCNDEEPKPEANDKPKPEDNDKPKSDANDKSKSDDQQNVNDDPKGDDNDNDIPLLLTNAACDEPISIENESVWGFIPELGEKMLLHQKKAFEFLWQNIAGSMNPTHMEAQSENRGGCVISHAPGAGKTFLTISFLISYLKLFPNKKPLILAPKTTLYTWYQEFIKWNFPMPVHLIHSRRSQRSFSENSFALPGIPNPNEDVKHTMDCLGKIQKWHAHPSVLVMGYTSFLSLMNENSKYEHKKYMAKALKESPGIIVLDEGHNPRSTKSNLRKWLMKVKTELRILLSGTLFQNNFGEYFNTLCLARPRFVHEVLQELDPKYVKSEAEKKAPHLVESRARKFFMDKIAVKIDAGNENVEEKMMGLNMLKKISSGFIDVYDSGNADSMLPGLQIYTLLMNNTEKQSEILQKLQKKMNRSGGYPLEVEFLITLVSIHPWLISTTRCAKKFFTSSQLEQLEKCKIDMKIGSKVKFVMSLVFRVVKMKEKVIIFCRNLAPMWLLLELFETYFKWKMGVEILTLHGEQELFERGKVIDKFEDRRGASKVLLASISACAEGISLTAASRVIFLDSEWNPSKTKQAIARAFRPGQEKVVYVYQLLAAGSFEEDKYKKTNWKDWVSRMIFSEDFVEDPSKWQAQKIEDDVLREMAEVDKYKSIHQIVKNEKASTNL